MKRLAPNLFDRRFDDLIETGRSRLPSLAPRWTDYNAHDPGITLMELLAYTAEAQMYSLARMRRDERAGYAALLGLRAQGPSPASGMLWPERADPDSPFLSFQQTVVIEPDAIVRTTKGDGPPFHPTHRILWTPGHIVALRTLLGDGRIIDHTRGNAQGDREFEPFGAAGAPSAVLRLEYETNGERGLFPKHRELAAQAYWPLGVRVAPVLRAVTNDEPAASRASPLAVEMRIGTERIALPVLADGTRGFMQSGVILLDVAGVPDSPAKFALEMRAPRGFARAPRILVIEPGVLPIVQGGSASAEAHATTGMPGQRIELETPGLRFGDGAPPVKVIVQENAELQEWQQVDDLGRCGPDDRAYELDTGNECIVLGNGINGYLPEAGCAIGIDYPYCDGSGGNTPRRQHWSVRGISGVFGINPDAIGGGRDADTDLDLRRTAREQLREAHALVTAADLEAAALSLADLEVARVEVSLGKAHAETTRDLTLLALRARATADEPDEGPETSRWLAAVRRGLLARMPLGTRLSVRAPVYRAFTLTARVEALPRRNPDDIESAIRDQLRDAFTLTPRRGLEPREFGAPVTRRDLAALIRKASGVRRVISLALLVDGKTEDTLELARRELPRLNLAQSLISVERAAGGAT